MNTIKAPVFVFVKYFTASIISFKISSGLLKKTLLEEYTKTKKSTGIAAITIKDGDSLASIHLMDEENLLLITKQGMSIHFETKDINSVGRIAAGVKAIKLNLFLLLVAQLILHLRHLI